MRKLGAISAALAVAVGLTVAGCGGDSNDAPADGA
jgi:hypothetical protein